MLDVSAGQHDRHNQLPSATAPNLSPLPSLARFVVRCRPAAIEKLGHVLGVLLPQKACRASVAGDRAALWLGPDEWLLLANEADASAIMRLSANASGATPHSLVEVSDAYTGLTIDGPQAAHVLNHGCPLDLSLSAFPSGMCTRTILGKAQVVLWRKATETFHLEIARSFGAYAWQFLKQARSDYDT
jgi:sarcosine oxidase subunit gamma